MHSVRGTRGVREKEPSGKTGAPDLKDQRLIKAMEFGPKFRLNIATGTKLISDYEYVAFVW